MHQRAVTLKDVAAAAGVSVSTVSRVLDERLPPSRSASAERVRRAAAELGYHRDVTASALRRGGTSTVGVLVPRLSDTVMALLFEAVYAEAAQRGLFALVSVCGDDPAEEAKAVDMLLSRRVEGLVLAAARLEDPLTESLRRRRVPHALALRTDGVSPAAVCNDELGGYLATRHLIDLGHTSVAVLPGPEFASTAQRRLRGYHRAMREAGLDSGAGQGPGDGGSDAVEHSGFGVEDGRAAALRLLGRRPQTTAVFAANDSLALGAAAAAGSLGRRLPEELSVVGYNDTPVAELAAVALTTVRVPFNRVAADALDLLTEQTAARSPVSTLGTERVSVPTLIPRDSAVRATG